jgi:hypothetical protein
MTGVAYEMEIDNMRIISCLKRLAMNQYERCECHECTQARWKMSLQGQWASAGIGTFTITTGQPNVPTNVCDGCGQAIPINQESHICPVHHPALDE